MVVDASDNPNSELHGGRLQFYWQVWHHSHCHPRVVQILRFSYPIIPQSNPPKSVFPTIHRGYSKPENHRFLTECVSEMLKKGLFTLSRFAQLHVFAVGCFLYPNPEKMASCDRSQCPEQLPACPYVQNGNSRHYQKLSQKRRMAIFHRSERCVLSCSHSSRFSTLATFPCRQKNTSIRSSAMWVSDGTATVHANCKRSKTHSSVLQNSSSPVPGRLVVESRCQIPVSAPDKRTHPCGERTRLCDKLRKIRARTYTKKSTFWVTISI